MRKITFILIAILTIGAPSAFAGTSAKQAYQFTSLEAIQTSWDYAVLRYNINDLNTGESLEIPSFLLNYEVKNNVGKTISTGSGLYISINDNKLASMETYSIIISATINGEKISRTVCKKASPKKLEINMNSNNLSYNVTRPNYQDNSLSENIQIASENVFADVSVCSCSACETYKINPYDKGSLKALQIVMQQMSKEGKQIQLPIASAMVYNAEGN